MVSHDPKRPQSTNIPPLATTQSEPLAPHPPADIPKWVEEAIPRLDLVIENVLCPGATRFLAAIQPASLLRDAIIGVLLELYDEESVPSGVDNLSLIIKETEGVAATRHVKLLQQIQRGSGHTHKTIIFNAKYIEKLGSRARDEIMGVVRHEVVHCFQHDAHGTAPIGLIEGIADFVRLRAELSPPHWKRENKGEHWDAGYEKTGFFLDWLEQAKGAGTVRRINLELSHGRYHRKKFWKNVLGETIEELWEQYKATD